MSTADIDGITLHYAEHGTGGDPLVLLHGGIHGGEMFDPLVPALADGRRVVVVDLDGHGRSPLSDRPLRPQTLADDVAGLLRHLGLAPADVLGYSLGGEVALRLAIQHPDAVRRLVVVSASCARDGAYPEIVAQFDAMGPGLADMIRQAPVYAHYAAHNPRPEDWDRHIARTVEALKVDFDWRDEIPQITAPTLLVYADADCFRPAHVAELYALLGGGLRDGGLDGSGRPPGALAVLPGSTHYDLLENPLLVPAVVRFLDG
jgi:pimeloyl-ACP methyl ester carboxylesterase